MPREYIERSYVEYLVDHFGGMLTWSKEDILSEIKRNLYKGKKADVVEVVKCKDCKFHTDEEPGMVYCPGILGNWVNDDWYCGDGERKEEK